MTEDEILDMPAGREMDALIAEEVMEWGGGFGISLRRGVTRLMWVQKPPRLQPVVPHCLLFPDTVS
jgi:hypothetical protein